MDVHTYQILVHNNLWEVGLPWMLLVLVLLKRALLSVTRHRQDVVMPCSIPLVAAVHACLVRVSTTGQGYDSHHLDTSSNKTTKRKVITSWFFPACYRLVARTRDHKAPASNARRRSINRVHWLKKLPPPGIHPNNNPKRTTRKTCCVWHNLGTRCLPATACGRQGTSWVHPRISKVDLGLMACNGQRLTQITASTAESNPDKTPINLPKNDRFLATTKNQQTLSNERFSSIYVRTCGVVAAKPSKNKNKRDSRKNQAASIMSFTISRVKQGKKTTMTTTTTIGNKYRWLTARCSSKHASSRLQKPR